jgi:hypothetical protein
LDTANLAGIIIAFDGAMSQELKWEEGIKGKDGNTMSYKTYPDNFQSFFQGDEGGSLGACTSLIGWHQGLTTKLESFLLKRLMSITWLMSCLSMNRGSSCHIADAVLLHGGDQHVPCQWLIDWDKELRSYPGHLAI